MVSTQNSEEEKKGDRGRGRRDMGVKDGKKRRPKQVVDSVESIDASSQQSETVPEEGFSCKYASQLRKRGFTVTRENCAGNVFSAMDKKCRGCMKCVCPQEDRLKTACCLYEMSGCMATVVVDGNTKSCLSLRA